MTDSSHAPQTRSSFKANDVVKYAVPRYCREGVAVARLRNGKLVLRDTYWLRDDDLSYVLTADEVANAELLFNTDDYDELDRHARSTPTTWATYAEADRAQIPMQHGRTMRYFVRKGSTPDLATQVANARALVSQRRDEVRTAQLALARAESELARLDSELAAAIYRPLESSAA
ncbi:hypothetical protein [Microbacterium gorillae]|uniref:hypothetical protein n=1 Tax=Microbacterium gorillae TaxID=1231063 RepID=UPI003D97C55A